MNIIEELYYGNLNPTEKYFNPSSEYGKNVKIISDNEEKLTAYLSAIPTAEKEKHLLEQLINAQNEILFISEFERFKEGFKLGARLITDT